MLTKEQADERVGHRVRILPSGAAVTLLRHGKGQGLVQFPGCNGNAKRWFPLSKLRVSTVFDAEDGLATEPADEATQETNVNEKHGKNGQAAEASTPDRVAEPDKLMELIGQIRTVKAEIADCDRVMAQQGELRDRLKAALDDLKVKLIDAA